MKCCEYQVPPNVSNNARSRRINETNTYGRVNQGGGKSQRGGRGRGFGRSNRYGSRNGNRGGRGRGGRFNNQSGEHNNTKPFFVNGQSKSNKSWMTASEAGKAIECYPRALYPGEIWQMIPHADKDKINSLRRNSGGSNNPSGGTVISEITQGTQFMLPPPPSQHIQQQPQFISQVGIQPPLPPHGDNQQRPTQVSFMGGRNEQASLRNQNPGVP